jgi:hypothetical protein
MPLYKNNRRAASLFFNGKRIAQVWKNGVKVFQKSTGGAPDGVLLTPAMTSATTPAPFVVTSSNFNTGASVGTVTSPDWQAFDQNPSRPAHATAQGAGMISIDLGVIRTVTGIKLYSRTAGYQQDTPRHTDITVRQNAGDAESTIAVYDDTPIPAGDHSVFVDWTGSVPARYVTFNFLNNRGSGRDFNVLSEIEIYGY